jgi:thymidine phosphorylase
MVTELGGPADFVDRARTYLPRASTEFAVMAPHGGFVTAIATRDIGLAVVELGGGRRRPDDKVDHSVGLTQLLPVGSEVFSGEPLALAHARSKAEAERAAAVVLSAYTIGEAKPPAQKAVIRRISPRS